MAMSHDGKFVYVIHELIPQVAVMTRDAATGALTHFRRFRRCQTGLKGTLIRRKF